MPTTHRTNNTAVQWAVLIKKHEFFMDAWDWHAMPYLENNTLGAPKLGGTSNSEEDAKQMAQAELLKRGITRAVLLEPNATELANFTE